MKKCVVCNCGISNGTKCDDHKGMKIVKIKEGVEPPVSKSQFKRLVAQGALTSSCKECGMEYSPDEIDELGLCFICAEVGTCQEEEDFDPYLWEDDYDDPNDPLGPYYPDEED